MAHLSLTPEELSALLLSKDAPLILDMRDEGDSAADPRRIPGARPTDLAALEASDFSTGNFVCTCQKGGKLSQLGAAILRNRGATAFYLSGGYLDWVAADLPLTGSSSLAARWVVPTDCGWDELAAIWVLRRLVDRTAPILPVTRDWLAKAAETWDACIVPGTVADLAKRTGLTHPALPHLTGGPDHILSGRLTRVTTPLDALDLVDDHLAGAFA